MKSQLKYLAIGLTSAALLLNTGLATTTSAREYEPLQPRPSTPSNGPIYGPVIEVNQPSTVMFQPDVRVNFLGKTLNGGTTTYRFRVANIGAASADNVFADGTAYELSNDGSVGMQYPSGGKSIATLNQDEAVEVTVSCAPHPGYHCDGASLKAFVQDDLDPSNNKAAGS